MSGPRPVAGVAGQAAYRVPRPLAPVDLHLDGNEGAHPDLESLLGALGAAGLDAFRRYPKAAHLQARLAALHGVRPDQVLVAAGGDDAIDRLCRAVLCPGRSVVLPSPSFEMIGRYARLAGAEVIPVDWPAGAWPLEAVLEVSEDAALICVVSPNNPTGDVVSAEQLRAIAEARPEAVILVDLAYVEFAEIDLTPVALSLPNTVLIRTFSKAWGLAGLRVGYALGPAEIIGWLRVVGAPYAVAAPSLAVVDRWLDDGAEPTARFVAQVRLERDALHTQLTELGCAPRASQGNFVFCEPPDAHWLQHALAGLGIGVRAWPGHGVLGRKCRITCPGDAEAFARLRRALDTIYRPQALLLDLDGVLADVSSSYRQAMIQAAATFGVSLTQAQIAAAKAAGDANNDWILTQRLCAQAGVTVSLQAVTDAFEAAYQGTEGRPGLWQTERLLVPLALMEQLSARLPIAIVTGRPRGDAERFLGQMGLAPLVSAVVCMQDAPAKPDPAPVRLALAKLGLERAWMVGDTPDDLQAARGAGVLPIGILAPQETDRDALLRAGAACILETLGSLEAMF